MNDFFKEICIMEPSKDKKYITDTNVLENDYNNHKNINTNIDDDVSKKSFTCKQKTALCLLAAVDFMSFCSMSIMAPFFPKEAESKGMSETLAGFVFSFYALVMFIFSPIFGKILPRVGVKLVFVTGILTSGICSIIFGCLEYVHDNNTFTILSFAIRGMEALGASAYSTAGYVVVMNIFPHHAGTVRGILETFVGLGMSVGPAVGGLLFAVGGFGLPFYVTGLFTIALAPLNIYLLQSGEECIVDKNCGSMRSLLKLPATIVTCLIIIVVSITWSFLDPTLEPHLRKFSVSAGNIGLIFLLLSATYGVSCPACGWLADKLSNYWYLMVGGLIFSSLSLLVLGPSPVLVFLEDSIWLNIIALSTLGISVGMALMPTFQGLLNSAVEGGLGDNLGTNSMVAGLWSCVYSLGEVIGPAVGGALLEHCGFPFTATFMAALNFIVAIGAAIYFSMRQKSNVTCNSDTDSKNSEKYKNQDSEGIFMTNGKYLNGSVVQ